jgi:hypothetical protein
MSSKVIPINPTGNTDSTSSSTLDSFKKKGFFDLIEKVGALGKYQTITLLFWSLACYIYGGFALITPFLFF